MEKIALKAEQRTTFGKKVRLLRANGQIPAVVYGHGKLTSAITLDEKEFGRVYSRAGHSTILELQVGDDNKVNVLVQDVVKDPLSSHYLHADLYLVRMDEVIRTAVPIHFVGESEAVYKLEGSLLTNLEELEVEALPADLPSSIEVDIVVLDNFDKSITIADISVPDKVKVLNEPEELVVKVDPPRSDEELEALDEDVVENIPTEEGEIGEEGEETEETPESDQSEVKPE